MKMAASFHQRVVVGEDKPANNNTPRDHHRTPRDSSTSEDRLRVYQEKSREVRKSCLVSVNQCVRNNVRLVLVSFAGFDWFTGRS
jgi:hypothetical protein